MNEKFSESDTLKSNVNNYLHYGYLPPEEIPKFWLELPHQDKVPTEVSLTATIELFDEVFREAIEKSRGSGFCIVPLSGEIGRASCRETVRIRWFRAWRWSR